jgi:hypothetical protein
LVWLVIALCEAVITVEFAPAPKPKETPLELEKLTVLVEIVAPPAAMPLNASVFAFDCIAVVSHAGCCIQTVFGPPTAVLWESVMDCEPANTQSTPVDTPVFPAVCPVFETPNAFIADWLD